MATVYCLSKENRIINIELEECVQRKRVMFYNLSGEHEFQTYINLEIKKSTQF